MELGHPLPWFGITALCLLVAAAFARGRFFAETLSRSDGRYEAIDGLRGFLALGVFGAHAVNMYTLHTEHVWSVGNAPFYNQAGDAGVSLFFQVTAFLFWLRILKSERMDWRAFFAARVRRLAPMYFASVALALLVIAACTGFALHSSPFQLLKEIRPWLSFGFMRTGELNGLDAHPVNAVYWSLAYEWAFYVALPFLAFAARGAASVALFGAILFFGSTLPMVFHFMFGALVAMTVHTRLLEPWIRRRSLAPLPFLALLVYFLYGAALPALAEAALLAVLFVFVAHGHTMFGLFRTAAAKVLGTISYSFYLTHCIILYAAAHAAHALVSMPSVGIAQYWVLAALAALATVVVSAFTYRHVEFPFLRGRDLPAARAVHRPATLPLTRVSRPG